MGRLQVFLALAAGLSFATGCDGARTSAAPRSAAAAPHRGPVAIFASREPGAGRELGAVVVRGGFGSDVRELFPELVYKVQALGGNTLVVEAMGAHFEQGGPGAGFALNGAVRACPYGCRRSSSAAPIEAVTVELKGRALWLTPEELDRAERGAP